MIYGKEYVYKIETGGDSHQGTWLLDMIPMATNANEGQQNDQQSIGCAASFGRRHDTLR